MEFRTRKELVGKRFLSICHSVKLKSKISDWEWQSGIVRAVSSRDSKSTDINVLVEHDGGDWKLRRWLLIHRAFQLFLVEDTVCLVQRVDPRTGHHIWWPALRYMTLVDTIGLPSYNNQPYQYLVDHKLDFISPSKVINFPLVDSPLLEALKKYPDVEQAVKEWSDYQDGQHILLTSATVLAGCRVCVYRCDGTTQWYTAVIKTFNPSSHTLSVISDTVLQHNDVDPATIQMQLIDDGGESM